LSLNFHPDCRAAQEDKQLIDTIEVGMWTGARIEEICALPLTRVYLDRKSFEVEDAKTEAGWREVPIHSKLLPTMERLVKESTDGYLIPVDTLNKYGDRSNAIGKRFGYMKTALGYGPGHVFHSIRKTVSTLFENAGVLENIAAAIIGHDVVTMTYGVYSGGPSLEVKRAAIEKISYD
jgi:integrase